MTQATNMARLAQDIRKAMESFKDSGLNEDLGNAEALKVYKGLCQAMEALEAHVASQGGFFMSFAGLLAVCYSKPEAK